MVRVGTAGNKATNKLSAKTRFPREKAKEITAARVKETQREKAREKEGRAITVGVMGTDGRTVKRAKERGRGNKQWSVDTLCGLQEVGKGREASRGIDPLVSATSPKTAAGAKEESKPAQVVGGAFASLIAEESDEEDEAPGFQSQKNLYAEKERGQ